MKSTAKWIPFATAPVISALAMGVAQCIPGWGWLSLIALIPLCLAIERPGFLRVWALLALFSGVHTLLTALWIRQTGTGFGWFVAAAVAYEAALTIVPAAGVWIAGQRRASAWIFLLPALWMVMELSSRRVLFAISWALVGLPLADYPGPSQVAALAGPETLSLLVISSNIALAILPRRRNWSAMALAGAAFLGILIFGESRASNGSNLMTENIAVVQPMLSQQTRWDHLENRPPLLARLNRLIDRAAEKQPALIVLPEAALPGLVRYDAQLATFATDAVRRTGTPLLFGSVDRDEQSHFYNVAILINTDGTDAEYRKRRLAPFVERTPWPFHYSPPDGWVQFTPGNQGTRIRLNVATSVGVAMCLEDTNPDLARDYANDGANVLISLVNTENFKNTSQALAHLRRARLTAIAAGIPMVRAANSGISCSIDAHGGVMSQLPPNREDTAMFQASLAVVTTAYGLLGDAGVIVLLLLFVLLGMAWLRMERTTAAPERVSLKRRSGRTSYHPSRSYR